MMGSTAPDMSNVVQSSQAGSGLLTLSVIMVTMNASASIRASLASIRAQTYRPIELVVVDGGSQDSTVDIAREYSELFGSCISEPDAGIYDAMNKGVQRSTGEVLFFLNADDSFAHKDVVTHAISAFDDPKVDLVFGDVACVYPDGPWLKRQGRISRYNILFEGLCQQSVFARRRVFDRVGEFDRRYRLCGDFDWFVRAFRKGVTARHIPGAVANYSMSGLSEREEGRRRLEMQAVQRKYFSAAVLPVLRLGYRLYRRILPTV